MKRSTPPLPHWTARARLTVRISPEARERLRLLAARTQQTQDEIVDAALRQITK